MADTPISGLTDGSPAAGTDLVPVARGAGNRKLTLSAVRTYMQSNLHPVALSGSYNDLGNKPSIPATGELPEGIAASVFDVKDPQFAGGAKGDGVTDDTAAIQAALDAAYAAGGGTVVVSTGTFMVKGDGTASHGALRIKSNVTLAGAGMGATIIQLMDTQVGDLTGIVRTPSGEKHENIIVRDLSILGTGDTLPYKIDGFFCGRAPSNMLKVTVSGTTATGVSYEDNGLTSRAHGLGSNGSTKTIYIKHDSDPNKTGDFLVTVVNSTTFTFTVPSGTANDNGAKSYTWHYSESYENAHQKNITCERVEISYCYRYGFDPHEGTDGLTLRDCKSHHNGIGGGGDNFTLDCIINGLVENCEAWAGGRNGITTPTGSRNVRFIGNKSYDNAQYGFASQRGSNTSPRNRDIVFENNESYGNREGFRLNMTIGGRVVGNTAHDNRQNGILLEGVERCEVADNTCYDNGQAEHDKHDHIKLKQYAFSGDGLIYPCSGNIVRDNLCWADKAVKVRYSIDEQAGASCDDNAILDNKVSGSVREGSYGGVLFSGPNSEFKPPLTVARVVTVEDSSILVGSEHRGAVLSFAGTAAQSAIVQNDTAVNLPVHASWTGYRHTGAGGFTLKAQVGVSINGVLEQGSGEATLRLAQWARGATDKIGPNEYYAYGDWTAPGAVTGNVIAVGAGQSNMVNQFSEDFNESGELAFLAAIDAVYDTGTNYFVNGAEGGSYVSRRNAEVGGGSWVFTLIGNWVTSHVYAINDGVWQGGILYRCLVAHTSGVFATDLAADKWVKLEYWVDDLDDDPANWTAGPELNDFYTAITGAALVNGDVNFVPWSQGEADASGIRHNVVSQDHYKTALEWLFQDFRDNLANLEYIVIQPLSKRASGSSNPGYQYIREVQTAVAAEFGDVVMSAELYDQGLSDLVHMDEAGYAAAGERNANRILRLRGETVTHATGPRVSDIAVSVDGEEITLTIEHDGGTTLNGWTSTPVDVQAATADENFFRLFALSGAEITPDTIEVTGADEITFGLPVPTFDDVRIYGGYGSMSELDADAIIDDGTLPLQCFVGTALIESADEAGKTQAVTFSGTTENSFTDVLDSGYSLARSFVSNGGARIDNGSHAARDAQFSTVLQDGLHALATRQYSSPVNGAPTIYACGHAVQIPASLRDGVFRTGLINLSSAEFIGEATLVGDDVVDPTRSFVFMPGLFDVGTTSIGALCHLSMDDQTVTVSRVEDTGELNVPYVVWQLPADIIVSMQEVTAAIVPGATSVTVTLDTPIIDPSNAACFMMGVWWDKVGDSENTSYSLWHSTHALGYLSADGLTFVAERFNNTAADHTSYVKVTIVELEEGHINVQRGRTAITGTLSTPAAPDTLATPVPLNQSFIQMIGRKMSATGGNEYQVFCTVEQTDTDEITVTRGPQGVASSTLAVSWELITLGG